MVSNWKFPLSPLPPTKTWENFKVETSIFDVTFFMTLLVLMYCKSLFLSNCNTLLFDSTFYHQREICSLLILKLMLIIITILDNGNKVVTPHSSELELHHLMQFYVWPRTHFFGEWGAGLTSLQEMQSAYSRPNQQTLGWLIYRLKYYSWSTGNSPVYKTVCFSHKSTIHPLLSSIGHIKLEGHSFFNLVFAGGIKIPFFAFFRTKICSKNFWNCHFNLSHFKI